MIVKPRARKRSDVYRSPAWKIARQQALARDLHCCQDCGETRGLSVHHIEAVADGGAPYELGNLLTLCSRCHRRTEELRFTV